MHKEPLRRQSFFWLVAMASVVVFHAPPLVAARCRMPAYDAVLQTSLERPLGPRPSLLVELVPTWSRPPRETTVRFAGYTWRLPEVALVDGATRYPLTESALTNNLHALEATRAVPPGRYHLVGVGDPRPVEVGDTPRYPTTAAPALVDVDVTVRETRFTCRGGYLGYRVAARFREDPGARGVAFVRLLSPGLGPSLIDVRGGERDGEGRVIETYNEHRCAFARVRERFGASGPYHYALIYEDGTVRTADAPVPVRVTVPPDLGQRCRRR